jgi:hypothetical protein
MLRLKVTPLIKFVNNWSKLLEEFEFAFVKHYEINLKSLKRISKLMKFSMILSFLIPQIKAATNNNQFLTNDYHPILNMWFKSSFFGLISASFIMSTLITMLSFHTLRVFYREVITQFLKLFTIQIK